MKLTLGKDKRLKSRKKIDQLFISGQKTQKFPIKAMFILNSQEENAVKISVSVPKRLFKKAVDRNLLKRRMREAFRIHQLQLKTQGNLEIMFIYTSPQILEFSKIEKSMLSLIDYLNSISNDNNSEK